MALKLKHMEMYFMDNDAEGVRVAWFPSHVLKAYIVPRTKLKDAKQLIEHDRLEHGVYFLIGDTADGEKTKIYSGQTAQWLVRGVYENKLLWTLTATICYDATDIALLSALRDQVDCTIVASSNKDTTAYDSMAEAMRFHLYGHVVIANSGEFGGSTIQAPYRNDYERVIVHSHGHDQAVVSMATLHLNDFSKKRSRQKSIVKLRDPKTSPAGYKGRQ